MILVVMTGFQNEIQQGGQLCELPRLQGSDLGTKPPAQP